MGQYVEALERRVAALEKAVLSVTDVPEFNSGKTPGVWQTPGVSRTVKSCRLMPQVYHSPTQF